MIRVLHIFHNMGNGGTEHFVMDNYRRIDKSKVQFDFLTSVEEEGFFDKEIIELGGRIIHAYPFRKNPIKNYFSIAQIVKENQYSIVHRHTGSAFGYFDLRAARHGGASHLILHAHNTQAEKALLHKLSKLLFRTDCVRLACSEEAGRFLFGKKAVFSIIKNGIDCDKFVFSSSERLTLREEWNIGEKLVVGHIGRFEQQKNHRKLLEIFAAMHNQKPDSMLFCVGAGTMLSTSKQYAQELGIDQNVIFAGNRDDVDKIINVFDVFCFPSNYEGFGITLLEAQANGLRCYASKDVISDVANLSGNVSFIPLYSSSKYWADQILASSVERDLNAADAVRKAGYDISETALVLQNIYLSLSDQQEKGI